MDDTRFEGDRVSCISTGKTVTTAEIGVHSMCANNHALQVTESHYSPVSPPPFMVGMAEVEIDKETGELELIDYVAVVDCGTPLNPNLARVQVEGGLGQGIGMALYENVQYTDYGRMMNNSLMQYKIPARVDVCRLRVEFESSYEQSGPFGANPSERLLSTHHLRHWHMRLLMQQVSGCVNFRSRRRKLQWGDRKNRKKK